MGASAPESGSQVCRGTSGALIAKARKKPRNSHVWVLCGMSGATATSSRQSKVPPAAPRASDPATYSPITAASMTRPPSSEYRKNLMAAYWRRAPPKRPMMKYIGTSMASKNT